MKSVQRDRVTKRVALLSVVSNSTLVLLKLGAGIATGSVAVISEAVHSAMDLVAALIALLAVRAAAVPADEEHPYGHGKAENISGTIEALLIFAAAAYIIYEAIRKLLGEHEVESPGWGMAVMGVSAVVNIGVSEMLFRVARATDSIALEADGWHLRTDVWTSVGVLGALGFIALTEHYAPVLHFHWMDPVAAIGVALLIIHAAWKLTITSARDLMDVALPDEEGQAIHHVLTAHSPGVRGFHNLRTRKAGSQRFVDVHVLVDPAMTVATSHALSDVITDEIQARLPNTVVVVHIEPCDDDCDDQCGPNCLVHPPP
ncbi:MAG: cation diffusion facilitator family transporter [Armatimonadota bacterium]